MSYFGYDYFCGANVTVFTSNREEDTPLIECGGISFAETSSSQPVYGYSSVFYDAVAPGKRVVQGSFVINYVTPNYLSSQLSGSSSSDINNPSYYKYFDISVDFGNTLQTADPTKHKNIFVLKDCFIVGSGMTIQIDEQTILEEYQFIGRNVERKVA